MTPESEGSHSRENVHDLLQSVNGLRLDLGTHLEAMIAVNLGHSVQTLANDPALSRELLGHDEAARRQFAAIYVGRFDPNPAAFEPVLRRLAIEDPAPEVRSAAISALAEIGARHHDREIVAFLHSVLANLSEETRVRKSAYAAMLCIEAATKEHCQLGEISLLLERLVGLGDGAISIEGILPSG